MKATFLSWVTGCILLTGCGPSIPASSALNCFNAELYKAGNQYKMANYNKGKLYNTVKVVFADGTFEQQPALVEQIYINSWQQPDTFEYVLSNYLQLDTEKGQIRYQARELTYDDIDDNQRQTFSPAVPQAFNFEHAGAQQTISYRTKTNYEAYGVNFPETLSYTRTTEFIGMETLKTAVGEFETCHLRYNKQQTHEGTTSSPDIEDAWYAKNTGLPVKRVTAQTQRHQELISATINGEQVVSAPSQLLKLSPATVPSPQK